jgi:hypothetical protein
LEVYISGVLCTQLNDHNNGVWTDFHCIGEATAGNKIVIKAKTRERIAICGLIVFGKPVFDSTLDLLKTTRI